MFEIVVASLVIWTLFGIASAIVAKRKGRNGCGWFLLGVLFGPFGLILALVVSSDNEALSKAKLESGQMKKCPYCAELVQREAIKCRFCGSALSATQHDATSNKSIVDPLNQPEEKNQFNQDNNSPLKYIFGFMLFIFALVILIGIIS